MSEKKQIPSPEKKNAAEAFVHADVPENKIADIRKLFGHCFEMGYIKEGQRVPVGGENYFTGDLNIHVEADLHEFQEDFSIMDQKAKSIMDIGAATWLQQQGLSIEPQLFSQCFGFTRLIGQKYPHAEDHDVRRKNLYKKNKNLKLSEVFKERAQECAEIALIAQVYLQRRGIHVRYIGGDVLWNRSAEFSEPHSFLVIDNEYIFDAANPLPSQHGTLPSIYKLTKKFSEATDTHQKKLLEAKNIFTGRSAFFGVSDGTNVSENDIM